MNEGDRPATASIGCDAGPQESRSRLNHLFSSSTGEQLPTASPRFTGGAAGHRAQNGRAPKSDESSAFTVVPPLFPPVVNKEATGSFQNRLSTPLGLTTTPTFSRCASPSHGTATRPGTLSPVLDHPSLEKEMHDHMLPTDASPPQVSIIGTNGTVANAGAPVQFVDVGEHILESGRSRRKPREAEVSFAGSTPTALGAELASLYTTGGASRSFSSGEDNLCVPNGRLRKASDAGSMTSSGAISSFLPVDGARSKTTSWITADASHHTSSSASDDRRIEGADNSAGALRGESTVMSTGHSVDPVISPCSPKSSSGIAPPLISFSTTRRSDSHFLEQRYCATSSSFTEPRPLSSHAYGSTATRSDKCTCRVPVSVAVVISTVITVILVASLTIAPLNTVSIQSADYVTSTLSLSLASSYTRSVEATMSFLPNAISAYAFAYMGSSDTNAWEWTAADMPQAMRQLCHTVAGTDRSATPFLLYLSFSSPYTGYSAYCSKQYNNQLAGNYITDNSSHPRYYVSDITFSYVEPLTAYPGVQSMTPSEYTVSFGGASNPWNKVVMPWYESFLESHGLDADAGSPTAYRAASDVHVTPPASLEPTEGSDSKYLNGYWRVFTTNNLTVLTYTLPFVDYAGNPASITGALQPDGCNTLRPGGLIASGSSARAMVVDTSSGLVFINSWGQETKVRLDNWDPSPNSAPVGSDKRAVYLEDISDPLMVAAVKHIGGRKGIEAAPLESDQWMGQFTADKSDNLMVVSRVPISSAYSDMHLVVIYAVQKSEFTELINNVQRSALIAVLTVLVIIVLVEVALLYLLVQPVRGVAAGLRAAAELRDGRECVEHVPSVIKEVAEMQHDFRIMNAKLMQMKTFLPQGMLGVHTAYSEGQGASDANILALPISVSPRRRGSGVSEMGRRDRMRGGPSGVSGEDENDDDGIAMQGDNSDIANELGSMPSRNRLALQRREGFGPSMTALTNFQLNDRVLLEEVNRFHRRYCSTIVFCMHLMESEISVKFLNNHCVYFTEGVLPCVLRYGGVVELQRPDYIVVSFGAHNKVALHQNRAAKCALEVMHVLNTTTPIGPRVGCIIDASEYYVGTCGAADRNALVTFSNSLLPKGDLIRVLKSVQTQILLTQRLASTLESSMLVMPVDCMVLNPIGRKEVILYELRGHIRMLPPGVSEVTVRRAIRAVRMGFTYMLKGDYVKALGMLEPYEAVELQAARLGFVCRAFIARHIHRPFVRSVTRLTFSEAYFAGYEENQATERDDSHANGTPPATHGQHGVAGGSTASANPSGVSGGIGGSAAPFTFSSFNDVDPTAFLTTPPSMRLVIGAALRSPLPPDMENSTQLSERRAAARITSLPSHGSEGSLGLHNGSDVNKEEAAMGGLNRVFASLAAIDEDETALFELFVEDQPDDDSDDDVEDGEAFLVGRQGEVANSGFRSPHDKSRLSGGRISGELQAEGSLPSGVGATGMARSSRKGELPLFFNDYEGNAWRRSYDVLGVGAFSTVYRGLSMSGDLVALKCFRLSARNIEVHAIVDEVRVFANLHHENVVQYLSLYVSESYVIEIMEFVPGGSLDTLLKSFGSFRPESVRRYLRDIARGLSYLHREGIVHCDIKPHNVLLAMDGQCKLSDFGSAIARATSSVCKIDDVLEMRGTPGYMAPEVARGDVPTMKSDVYSLGLTVLELLIGKLPWDYAVPSAPNAPGKVQQCHNTEKHCPLPQQTGVVFVPDSASSVQGKVPQGSAKSSTMALNRAVVATRGGSVSSSVSSHLSLLRTLSHSNYTDPTVSIGGTVCGTGNHLLSVPSHIGEEGQGFYNSFVCSKTASLSNHCSGDSVGALERAPGEEGSAASTFESATTVPGFACVDPSDAVAATPNAVAESGDFAFAGSPLSGAEQYPLAINQHRQPRHEVNAPQVSTTLQAPDALGSSGFQFPHSLVPLQRRPIEQVIRSSTQLVVYIGRGLVVPHIPDTLDEEVIDFLKLCLNPDPQQRASMSELLLHPWLM
ncbi:hypothetical protein JKF63_02258 [Porcisia hertigi]|uniref:mitogen-activated protein kinase kinase n=1 Tax=Porcisia hertigi TaxID=2761500 RepID=A0A836LCK0_9TRYP|nr:hypothetical protein JKF63_02258 [Porcisia hertigi]